MDTTVPVPLVRPVGLADEDTEEEVFEEDPPEVGGKKHCFWFPPLSRYCFNQFFFTNLLWQDVPNQSKKRSLPVKSETVKKARQDLHDAKALNEKLLAVVEKRKREARAAKLAAAVDAAEPVNSGPSSSARPWRSAQVPALHFYFFWWTCALFLVVLGFMHSDGHILTSTVCFCFV